jgi:DmsE family decaheme c-type cytochrome
MKTVFRNVSRLGFCVCLCVVSVALADTDVTRSEDCAMCHEDVAEAFQHNPHAVAASSRGKPACVTCHGDGLEHMDEGGDPALVEVPQGRSGAEFCLQCHDTVHSMFSTRSVHNEVGVHCDSCHVMHAGPEAPKPLLKNESNAQCADCHSGAANSFRRPFGHRLDRGGLQCVTCHNPHGDRGNDNLVVTSRGDGPCLDCHSEKRGPFVFPHVSDITGDCMSCHEPHGSSNPMALVRSRVDQLCLECHSPAGGSLGSQPPATHDVMTPRFRNCTVCHVAVHGSNTSPALLK